MHLKTICFRLQLLKTLLFPLSVAISENVGHLLFVVSGQSYLLSSYFLLSCHTLVPEKQSNGKHIIIQTFNIKLLNIQPYHAFLYQSPLVPLPARQSSQSYNMLCPSLSQISLRVRNTTSRQLYRQKVLHVQLKSMVILIPIICGKHHKHNIRIACSAQPAGFLLRLLLSDDVPPNYTALQCIVRNSNPTQSVVTF